MITGENIDNWVEAQIAKKPQVLNPPEFRSGFGEKGIRAIRDFVEQGGILVTLGLACDFAIEKMGLKISNVVKGLDSKTFFCPGSTLKSIVDTSHVLGYGMPELTNLVFMGNIAFDVN